MTADLVKRLRTMAFAASRDIEAVLIEAADRIEALEAANVELHSLSIGWMDAHDKLKAGRAYAFPSPVPASTLIAEAEARGRQSALEAAAAQPSEREKATKEALDGLLGLLVLVRGRPDISADVSDALSDNHRITAANEALAAYHCEASCSSGPVPFTGGGQAARGGGEVAEKALGTSPTFSSREAELVKALEDLVDFVAIKFIEYDKPCPIATLDDGELCRECESNGCIKWKLDRAREALGTKSAAPKCTCGLTDPISFDDPPESEIDPDCPLHGRVLDTPAKDERQS